MKDLTIQPAEIFEIDSKKRIFLVGMPGSGKTTIGRLLAERLQIPFLDLDEIIEQISHRSINEIFEQDGERAFRQTEMQILELTLASQIEFVMATGGGTPCFYNGMERLKSRGMVIYLKASPDILNMRLAEHQNRPLLTGRSIEDRLRILENLLEIRKSTYEKAHFTVETGDKSPEVAVIATLKICE